MNKYIIIGAGGHAKEVLSVVEQSYGSDKLALFDNTIDTPQNLFGFPVFCKDKALKQFDAFFLGVGSVSLRRKLAEIGISQHLKWLGIRSLTAQIAKYAVQLHETVDVMDGVSISNDTIIGKGTLLNRNANIHHDVQIGSFCEIAPGAQILGKVKIGNGVFVGAGAIILPNVEVNDYAIIGAGAVVTKNVEANTKVVGIPAKRLRK